MNAIRQTVEVKNHQISIQLPEDFNADFVDVIVLPKEEEVGIEMPESLYNEMLNRREKHESGESKSYTWDEVKTRISATRDAI